MRQALVISMLGLIAACQAPQPPTEATRAKAVEQFPGRPDVALIFNTDSNLPIVTSFGNGTLENTGGCLVFATREDRYTPVWPLGTRWDAAAGEIVTPAGGKFRLGKPVVLPGGPMGSASGSDLKPSIVPDHKCPQSYFGVHPN